MVAIPLQSFDGGEGTALAGAGPQLEYRNYNESPQCWSFLTGMFEDTTTE